MGLLHGRAGRLTAPKRRSPARADGKNFQGHVNISFASGAAGQRVNVSLGEQRTAAGVVDAAESHNLWLELAAGGAAITYRSPPSVLEYTHDHRCC
jgi:hypothetical protein